MASETDRDILEATKPVSNVFCCSHELSEANSLPPKFRKGTTQKRVLLGILWLFVVLMLGR